MNDKLIKFERYCDLLEKVYSTNKTATEAEIKELDALGYDLELIGVPETVADLNFNELEKELERSRA